MNGCVIAGIPITTLIEAAGRRVSRFESADNPSAETADGAPCALTPRRLHCQQRRRRRGLRLRQQQQQQPVVPGRQLSGWRPGGMASLSKSSESSWSVEAPKASTECETTMVVSMAWQASSICRKKMVRIVITDDQLTQDIFVTMSMQKLPSNQGLLKVQD